MRASGTFGKWFWDEDESKPHWQPREIIRFLVPAETPPLSKSIDSGVKAGIIGLITMAVFLSYKYMSVGGSPILPVRLIIFRLTENSQLASSNLGFLLGILLYVMTGLAVGAMFGVIMARLVGRVGILTSIAVGAIYGLLVWMVSQFVILDYVAPGTTMLYDQQSLAAAHVIYGVCLGAFGKAYTYSPYLLRRWRV